MNKNVSKLLVASLVTSAIAVPVSASANSAVAEEGIYVITGEGTGEFYTLDQFENLDAIKKIELLDNAGNLYLYLPGVGLASLAEMNEHGDFQQAIVKNESVGIEDLSTVITGEFTTADGEKVVVGEVTPPVAELTVESVSAITTTTDAGKTLEFAVNGETKAVDLEKLAEAGYTYEFTASKAVLANANTGELKAGLANGTTFDYTVTIFKDEEEVAKSTKVTATVIDSSAIVTEVTEISFAHTNTAAATTTLIAGETGTIKVLGKTKDMAADAKPTDISKLATFTTSKASVVTVDAAGNVKAGSALGTATVTVKVGDQTKTFDFTTVSETRTIDITKSKLVATDVKGTAGNVEIKVSVIDTLGEPVADLTKFTVGGTEYEKTAQASTSPVVYNAETKTYLIKATGLTTDATDVAVKAGDNATGVEIGKANVTILTAGEAKTFKLTATKSEIDLKELADADDETKATTELTFEGIDEKGLVTKEGVPEVKYASTDTSILTVDENGKVTAKKVGEAKVYAYLAEDGFKTPIAGAETTIKVVDNTPKITGVTFGKDLKITSSTAVGELALTDIITKVSVGNATATIENNGTIKYTDSKDNAVYTLGTVGVAANTIKVGIASGKVTATATNTVGKDTVEVDVLDIKGNLTSYSTTVAAELVSKNEATGLVSVAPATENAKLDAFISGISAKLASNKNVGLVQNDVTLTLTGELAYLTETGFWTGNDADNGNFVALKIAAPKGFNAVSYKLGNGNGSDVDGENYALVIQRLTGTSKSIAITWIDAKGTEETVTYTLNYTAESLEADPTPES